MTQISLEGVATINSSKGSFRFESGLPSEETIIEARSIPGRLFIQENADVEFREHPRALALPPSVLPIAEGDGWKLKRTSMNYLVQLKLPIGESRAETQRRIDNILPQVMGEMTLDKEELFEKLVA